MSSTVRSRVYGVVAEAPFALSTAVGGGAPDLTIVVAPPSDVPSTSAPGVLLGEYRMGDRLVQSIGEVGDELHLRLPGYLDAVFASNRAQVRVTPAPGEGESYLEELVGGPVMALWLLVTGRPPLHASGVVVDGQAVVFVGNSGAGKSSLATAMVSRGAVAVTDDIARLERVARGWVCHPGPGRFRLRPGAVGLADVLPAVGEEHLETADGRLAVAVAAVSEAVKVGAVVVPVLDRDVSDFEATRLRGVAAATAMVARPRVASVLEGEHAASVFRLCAEVAAEVAVWRLVVPWSGLDEAFTARLDEVVRTLLDE